MLVIRTFQLRQTRAKVSPFKSTVKRSCVFKNVIVYRIGPAWAMSLEQLEANVQAAPFVECGLTQEKSVGWTSPRGDVNGVFVESIGGQWLLKLMLESKAVPSSVINRKVKEAITALKIEAV